MGRVWKKPSQSKRSLKSRRLRRERESNMNDLENLNNLACDLYHSRFTKAERYTTANLLVKRKAQALD
jgi:hypothetical protein